jgi:hypothetical protein
LEDEHWGRVLAGALLRCTLLGWSFWGIAYHPRHGQTLRQ